MHLQKLSLLNFKNYPEAEFQFSEGVNCFVGDNGEGKTNLLDAIHYLSMCKSYFNPIDSQNILYDAPFFVIQGSFDVNGIEENIYCGLKRNQKKIFKRNQKEYPRLADHIGMLPVVMISPSDIALITGGSEERRKLIDSIISQFDHHYLDQLINYNQALAQRNELLKQFARSGSFDPHALEVWDDKMVHLGSYIHKKRQDFLKEYIPVFRHYFSFISQDKEQVDIEYDSLLNDADFAMLISNSRNKDRAMQFSTTGIHKDDLTFTLSGYPLKKSGSQGQQKSFLIALKLAQFDFIRKEKELKPLLLLDDIFDKLDHHRVKRIMELVNHDSFGQIFITDTHPERMSELGFVGLEDFRIFIIANPKIL